MNPWTLTACLTLLLHIRVSSVAARVKVGGWQWKLTVAAGQHGGVPAGEVGAGEGDQGALLPGRQEARRQRQHAGEHARAGAGAQHAQHAAAPHQRHLVKQLQLQAAGADGCQSAVQRGARDRQQWLQSNCAFLSTHHLVMCGCLYG